MGKVTGAIVPGPAEESGNGELKMGGCIHALQKLPGKGHSWRFAGHGHICLYAGHFHQSPGQIVHEPDKFVMEACNVLTISGWRSGRWRPDAESQDEYRDAYLKAGLGQQIAKLV